MGRKRAAKAVVHKDWTKFFALRVTEAAFEDVHGAQDWVDAEKGRRPTVSDVVARGAQLVRRHGIGRK